MELDGLDPKIAQVIPSIQFDPIVKSNSKLFSLRISQMNTFGIKRIHPRICIVTNMTVGSKRKRAGESTYKNVPVWWQRSISAPLLKMTKYV